MSKVLKTNKGLNLYLLENGDYTVNLNNCLTILFISYKDALKMFDNYNFNIGFHKNYKLIFK